MSRKSVTQPLEKWLQAQVLRQDAGALKPLPATRVLGQRFGVSHGTVFRLLTRMEAAGLVWRHGNGRFYPALAGKVLGRAKPFVVMLRRMQAWSSLCRQVMEGFMDECGERERPVLLLHNKDLMGQPSPESGLSLASAKKQKEMLEEFFLLYGDGIAGVLLDEIWRDEAIEGVFPEHLPLVSFSRRSSLAKVGSVVADFRAGALLAISHLLARGYEKIYLIDPLAHYAPAADFLNEASNVCREISGRDLPRSQIIDIHSVAQRRDFLRKLTLAKQRVGLICPEDNLSMALAQEMNEAGLLRRHGLISVMGTDALPKHEISCVRFDYSVMGREAASLLSGGEPEIKLIHPLLEVGRTTGES